MSNKSSHHLDAMDCGNGALWTLQLLSRGHFEDTWVTQECPVDGLASITRGRRCSSITASHSLLLPCWWGANASILVETQVCGPVTHRTSEDFPSFQQNIWSIQSASSHKDTSLNCEMLWTKASTQWLKCKSPLLMQAQVVMFHS